MSENWTTENIPNLSGKVTIITGANKGIGYETAKALSENGAVVVMACRSLEKAQAALGQIRAEVPNAQLETMRLDLASLDSVHQFTDQFKAQYDRLDVLLNNAGIMMVPYGTTQDGFERQFGVNHLGHFALTGLLIDRLRETPNARVVNVSSNGHRQGKMDFSNLMFEHGNGYSPLRAYGRSKLANILFTYELQRRFEAAGVDASAIAAHPGASNTGLADHLPAVGPLRSTLGFLVQSATMGALPTMRAAVDPQVTGGQYYGPGGFMELGGYPVVVQSSQASYNQADARRLWQVSEELTGIQYL